MARERPSAASVTIARETHLAISIPIQQDHDSTCPSPQPQRDRRDAAVASGRAAWRVEASNLRTRRRRRTWLRVACVKRCCEWHARKRCCGGHAPRVTTQHRHETTSHARRRAGQQVASLHHRPVSAHHVERWRPHERLWIAGTHALQWWLAQQRRRVGQPRSPVAHTRRTAGRQEGWVPCGRKCRCERGR